MGRGAGYDYFEYALNMAGTIVSSNPDIIGEEGRIPLLGMEGNRYLAIGGLDFVKSRMSCRLGMATAVMI
ncbi:MAG: hypothetical protein ACLU4J_03405 [Butyricimonas paravirosa]